MIGEEMTSSPPQSRFRSSRMSTEQVKREHVAIAMHAHSIVDFNVYFNHMFAIAHWAQLFDITFLGLKGLQAADARNMMVDMAMERRIKYLLFLDADHFVDKTMLPFLMENKHEAMVSGLICKRGHPYDQVGWFITKDGFAPIDLPMNGDVVEVGICAFGCTLINLMKISKLHKPYFRDTCDDRNVRSDVNLCLAFRDAGEKVFIDTRVLVGHACQPRAVYPQNAEYLRSITVVDGMTVKLREGMEGNYTLPPNLGSPDEPVGFPFRK